MHYTYTPPIGRFCKLFLMIAAYCTAAVWYGGSTSKILIDALFCPKDWTKHKRTTVYCIRIRFLFLALVFVTVCILYVQYSIQSVLYVCTVYFVYVHTPADSLSLDVVVRSIVLLSAFHTVSNCHHHVEVNDYSTTPASGTIICLRLSEWLNFLWCCYVVHRDYVTIFNIVPAWIIYLQGQ